MTNLNLTEIESRIRDCRTYNFGMRAADQLAHEDAPALLDQVKSLTAELAAANGAGRAAAIAEVRFLAEARAAYGHLSSGLSTCKSENDLAIDLQVNSVNLIADILDGRDDAKGWLPSWKWDDFDILFRAEPREQDDEVIEPEMVQP
jgi:hypothetical protein